LSLKLVEEGDNLASTSATKRMAECDGTTAGVKLSLGDSELSAAVHSLGSECFVDLEHINIVDGEASLLEGGWDGNSRADSHNFRRAASNCETKNATMNLKAELGGNVSSGKKHGSSSISNLTGVSCGNCAFHLIESWLQFSEGDKSGVLSHTIISVDLDLGLDAILILNNRFVHGDLLSEESIFLSLSCLGVALNSKLILLITRNLESLGDVLSSLTHVHETVTSTLDLEHIVGDDVRINDSLH